MIFPSLKEAKESIKEGDYNSIPIAYEIISDYKDNGIISVSESEIKTSKDIKLLNEYNVDGVLIGESLMRSDDKKVAINDFKSLI